MTQRARRQVGRRRMARATGRDVIVTLMQDVTALKESSTETQRTIVRLDRSMKLMEAAIGRLEESVADLKIAAHSAHDAIGALAQHARRNDEHLGRLARTLGAMADATARRLDDHETRLRALEDARG